MHQNKVEFLYNKREIIFEFNKKKIDRKFGQNWECCYYYIIILRL